MPGAPVGAEGRTERPKLEPAHVQLTGQLPLGNEAADIGAPERREAKRLVLPTRHLARQRLPAAVHVARPNPAAIALHAGVARAVQAPGPYVRPVGQRALIVHAVASQSCLARQLVAVVR